MRKIFTILAMALLAASCRGPAGPAGPPGRDGEDGEPGAYWRIMDFDIINWTEVEDEFFYAQFDFPELTKFIYDNGIVLAYIETEGKYQTPLPFTRYKQEVIDEQLYFWEEHLDFEYEIGKITFYLTPSDFYTGAGQPARTKIRVALVY